MAIPAFTALTRIYARLLLDITFTNVNTYNLIVKRYRNNYDHNDQYINQ